jgi:ATP-binding cassette subfamily B protein
VPFRLATSWLQGRAAIEAGSALRRRLLRGGLSIDRQRIRHKGAGQFFGLIVEGGLIESLAINGGVAALLSSIELGLAAVVLWLGSGALPVALLVGWTALTGLVAYSCVARRQAWTDERLDLSHLLLENMVGHRTRLAQQPPDMWHERDDALLERYSIRGAAMDRSDLWLAMAIPRGWLVVALTTLVPMAITGAPPEQLAVLMGGTLLAYRALRRLVGGLGYLAGAAIAVRLVAPIVRAECRSEAPASPSLVLPLRPSVGRTADPLAAQVRNVAFRYRPEGEPVLWDCGMKIPHGARLLLDGPSGSGKTTFASILAGLSSPDSGSVLADGLDRRVLGAAGWRSRVVMAPQPHHNYLLSGSLAFNLLMGRRWPARDADLAEAEEVCRELGLGDLLDRMPAGLWQIVGETGWQLSQGERTRVFLARALLQRSNVLVLDESFGALDPENLDRALKCVQRRAPTVLAIAHA